MSQSGHIDPDRQAWELFKSPPRDQPVHMLNLVRLKPLADYPEGHPNHGKGMTGREAYQAYGRTTAHIFKRLGGAQVWVGKPEVTLTGPQDEAWDIAFIAAYPNADAFISMVRDPEYQQLVAHRTAGVADSRLIRMSPAEPGEGFGE